MATVFRTTLGCFDPLGLLVHNIPLLQPVTRATPSTRGLSVPFLFKGMCVGCSHTICMLCPRRPEEGV